MSYGIIFWPINIFSIDISGRLSVVSMYLFTLIPVVYTGLSCNDEYLVLKICHLLVKGNLWFWFRKLSKVIIKIRFVLLFSPLKWRKRDGNQIELVWKVKSLRTFVYHKLYTKKTHMQMTSGWIPHLYQYIWFVLGFTRHWYHLRRRWGRNFANHDDG